MSVLKNFVFDLQFHNADPVELTSLSISGLTAGTTYLNPNTGSVVTTGSTAGVTVVKVDVTAAGAYTLAYGSLDENNDFAADDSKYLNVGTITINSATAAASYTLVAGTTSGTVVAGKFVGKSTSGGSISNNVLTYVAASGQTATIEFGASAGATTVTDGAVALSSASAAVVKAGTAGEVVGFAGPANGSIVVNSAGTISSIPAGATFFVGTTGASAATDVKYVVSTDGTYITAKAPADTGTDAIYLLNSALTNTVITTESGSGASKVDSINNAALAVATTLNVNGYGGGTAQGVYAYTDGSTASSYVLTKAGDVYSAGYTDSTALGTTVGIITPDGQNAFKYDGSGYNRTQTLTNTNAASTVTTVIGGSGDDVINYAGTNIAENNVAVTIDGGAGKDEIGFGAISTTSVVGGAGNDSIAVKGYTDAAKTTEVFIGGGDGKDTIDAVDNGANTEITSSWTVDGGAGDDFINFANLATAANKEWSIVGGEGNDNIVTGNISYSTIEGGAGADTIVSTDATNTISGGDGKDVFDISGANARANISDFVYGDDVLRVNAADDDALLAGANANTTTTEGLFGLGNVAAGAARTATIGSSGSFYAVTLMDTADAKDKVDLAWVKENAATIDASSITNRAVIKGTSNSEGDLLIGGAKSDTIYAGASDSIFGGAGSDTLYVSGNAGVYVGVSSTSGTDEVNGYVTGFDTETADAVHLVDGSIESATIESASNKITVKSGKGSLVLNGATGYSATGNKLLVGDKKVYSIEKGQSLAVSSSDDFADYFYGTGGSAITLKDYEDDINVDLSSTMFKNISTVTGGKGNTTLMGTAKADSLVGGAGTTSLYGGAGRDSLKSGSGVTTFFITTGAGKDSVEGFVTGTDDTKSDVVNMFNAGLAGITRTSDSVFTLKVSDSDSLQVSQASSGIDQKIQWVSGNVKGVAKIGRTDKSNSFSYDEEVTNYLGANNYNDTVKFSSSTSEVNLWLDQQTAYASIETFDASSVSGNVLIAGTAASETLKGGIGESSLWGGAGNGKDVLIGSSSGTNTFFYGLGNGSDSISGSSKDTVNLFDIQLSDLTAADVDTTNRKVVFTTTSGDTVSVSGGVKDFVVGGQTFTTNYASKSDWSLKE